MIAGRLVDPPSTDWPPWAGPVMAAGITLTGALMIYFLGRRQDNQQRFVADRRTAYADLVSSFVDIRMLITHDETRDGEELLKGMETFPKLRLRSGRVEDGFRRAQGERGEDQQPS